MDKRKKQQNKVIEKGIQYAEAHKWRYKKAGGSAHAWGRMLCPLKERNGCSMSIWSTPRDADVHAKQIRRRVDSCPHKEEN
ncbi:MAG: hypothetical protein A3F11_09400 [Gammaproteobacteria bacterium RIFCSPHIGHO2_12_FULL_37_14]|nr:MAG: hypothetical protein A3F11_09400 [Gammaproteobacteria bacterium RIFCSPHIGHO2_12_FULL_37_14]